MATEPITQAHLDALRYELKADIAQAETRLIKWMVGIMLSTALGSAAIAASITYAGIQLAS